MSSQVQFRRGTATQNNAFTGAIGEITYDTDNKTLRLHDGTTAGGGATVLTTGATQTVLNKTFSTGTNWNGNPVPMGYGGTGSSLTAAAGAVPYSTSSGMGLSLPGTSGQLLTSGGTGAPSWVSASTLTVGTAGTATTAQNILGGSAGQLMIQSDTNLTTFITAGAKGTFLQSQGPSYAPSWAAGQVTFGNTTVSLGGNSAGVLNGITSLNTDLYFVPLPRGNIAQRPGGSQNSSISAQLGMVRYNTEISSFEGFGAGNAWASLGGVKSVDAKAYITAEASAGAGDDIIRVYAGDSGTSTQVMWAATGNISILPTTQSTSSTTGALQVAGGAGIAGNLYIGGNLIVNGTTTTINSTIERVTGTEVVAGVLTANSTTASTSTTTGALVVAGGVGVAGAAYIGGTLNTTGAATLSSTLGVTGATTLSSTLAVSSTSTFTGATTHNGGLSSTTGSFSSTLGVTGATTLSSTLGVSGKVTMSSGSTGAGTSGTLNVSGDITTARSSTTGVIFLGTSGSQYLYFDGTNYNMPSGGLIQGGGASFAGSITPSANVSYNLGSSSSGWWNNIYGTATHALYADLAENYQADQAYEPGTVLVFGGSAEVTTTTESHNTAVAGIVSTDPAYIMNGALEGTNVVAVGLTGRLPCRVQGPVSKGQVLVTSTTAGVAEAIDNSKFLPGCVLGKALESINTNTIETIEVVVGRF